mmetsp:Transcript_29526/g.53569  ORF Transcript_29526/g.53569 Transcript_29526/m.53569 type:complete len:114 (+) Transcript_29526:122-463(+)
MLGWKHVPPPRPSDDTAFSSTSHANGENGTNTCAPGEGKSAEESIATQFTVEVVNAASAEEIDRIESLVKRGIFPGSSLSVNGGGDIPPPLPEETGPSPSVVGPRLATARTLA